MEGLGEAPPSAASHGQARLARGGAADARHALTAPPTPASTHPLCCVSLCCVTLFYLRNKQSACCATLTPWLLFRLLCRHTGTHGIVRLWLGGRGWLRVAQVLMHGCSEWQRAGL